MGVCDTDEPSGIGQNRAPRSVDNSVGGDCRGEIQWSDDYREGERSAEIGWKEELLREQR